MNKHLFFFIACLIEYQAICTEPEAQQMQTSFEYIFNHNIWKGTESISGTGSDLKQTEAIRINLPPLLKSLNIRTMLDAACGDLNWIKTVDLSFLDQYIGVDIVPAIIKKNKELYETDNRSFQHLNIAFDSIPKADLIFCRDCLVHLQLEHCIKVLQNFKKSGAKYLLTTTFTTRQTNSPLPACGWRMLNLQQAPFNFPEPLLVLNENCTEGNGFYHDKSLGLWLLEDIIL